MGQFNLLLFLTRKHVYEPWELEQDQRQTPPSAHQVCLSPCSGSHPQLCPDTCTLLPAPSSPGASWKYMNIMQLFQRLPLKGVTGLSHYQNTLG